MSRPRLVYVVTHPVSVDTLLEGQLAFMRERGFDVTVVASPGPELDRVREREGVAVVAVPMARSIRPAADAVALSRLIHVLARLSPDIVNASTPKAGLLGMLAARALGVRSRIYLLRGLRLETARGPLRFILGHTERIASAAAHDVVCVSESLRRAVVSGGFAPGEKARVLVSGSSNGVDLARFERTPERTAQGREWARTLGIEADEQVVGFVGRLHRDKGVGDFLDALALLGHRPRLRGILVGADLAGDVDRALADRVRAAPQVVVVPKTRDLAPLYARMDLLAFPWYREGFPNVPLEAAAASLAVAGYRSTGVVDAVVDGMTGTLVGRGDVHALARAIEVYLDDRPLADAHGLAGRHRAEAAFDRMVVWQAWEDFYRTRLRE